MIKLAFSLLLIFITLNVNAGEKITYTLNNEIFEGYVSEPIGITKGLVLIIHDWDGLTEYEETRANMISKIGYTAFAIDLYGKNNRPKETKLKKEETAKLYNNRERMRSLILAGLQTINKERNLNTFVIGYCFGGAAALELARSGMGSNIVGYATFHGGLKTPDGQSYPKNTPPIFIAHGGADKAIGLNEVFSLSKELEEQNLKYEINIYSNANHGFTVFKSKRYESTADKKSWNSFKSFLKSSMENK